MSEQATVQRGSFLEGLASLLRGSAPAESESNKLNQYQTTTQQLDSAVEQLRAKIKAEQQALAAREQTSVGSATLGTKSSKADELHQQQQELQRAVTAMREEIVALHAKLGTGLNESGLNELGDYFASVSPLLEGDDLEARIRNAIVKRVQHELNATSWSLLLQLMDSSNVEWPEPAGLLPNATEEEKKRATLHRITDSEQVFISHNFQQGIEAANGLVAIWKRYPDAGNWLWREVALRGAAAGIRAHLLRKAVEQLRENAESLRSEANKLLAESMAKIQSVLQSGVHSLDDAQKVVSGTEIVVTTLLPDLAWSQVKSQIDKNIAVLLQAR